MNHLSQWVGGHPVSGVEETSDPRCPSARDILLVDQRNESRLYVCRPTDLIPILKCSCNALCRVFGVHLRPWRSFIIHVFFVFFCLLWSMGGLFSAWLLITWKTSQSFFGSGQRPQSCGR